MGVDNRDWAKWSDEEQAAYLSNWAPQPQVTGAELLERIDSPYSSGVSLRIKVWGGLAVATALLAAIVTYGIATAPRDTASPPPASTSLRGPIVYGWRHVPPQGIGNVIPSRVADALDGQRNICIVRDLDADGRWVCTTYALVDEHHRIFVMPADSPLRFVACTTQPAVTCPGTTI
jgi:hypothetical protein